MYPKPEIEKLRVFHDLHTQFNVPDAVRHTLQSQLAPQSQKRIERFIGGFKIEDWFEWTFCPMPWVELIHGLDQQQFPTRSKEKYQVPDFLLLVETSALVHQPLLIEVKRVTREKQTLKLQKSQVALCEQYASALRVPVCFAVYWELFNAWTLNTVDSFESKSSSCKLPMTKAFELDCSAILGDISYIVPPLQRVSRFAGGDRSPACVQHDQFGRLLSDIIIVGNNHVEMTSLESAAIDSMLAMKSQTKRDLGDGTTEVLAATDEVHVPKLSSWITRHLAIFGQEPSEQYANVSANVIADLMKKLECGVLHLFPTDQTEQLTRIDAVFRTSSTPPQDAKVRPM